MLRKVIVDNVGSISHAELDLSRGNYQYRNENVYGEIVNPAVIYGLNGSGKTSFFRAVATVVSNFLAPLNTLSPFAENVFYYGRNGKDKGGMTAFEFSVDEDEYYYEISTFSKPSPKTSERLVVNNEEILKRDGNDFFYRGNKMEDEGVNPLLPYLRLLPSKQSAISDGVLQKALSFISSMSVYGKGIFLYGLLGTQWISEKAMFSTGLDVIAEESDRVYELIKEFSDFPRYRVIKSDGSPTKKAAGNKYFIVFDDDGFKGKLPFELASSGIYATSAILSILLSSKPGSVVFIDEFDESLHPKTIRAILSIAHRINVQLVLSSHNTYSLQDLRPDQIFFSTWKKGRSTIRKLSKIYPNIREINNIEKMYLSNLFDEVIESGE